jgi:hypothetical protein
MRTKVHLPQPARRLQITGVAAIAVVAASLVAVPAASASSSSAGQSAPTTTSRVAAHGSATRPGWSQVTLQLSAKDPSAVTTLARSNRKAAGARHDALRAAAPSASTASAVSRFLTKAGLTITASTSFSVTAAGPTALLDSLFPSSAASAKVGSDATARVSTATATSSPLQVPSALRGRVTFASGGSDSGARLRPLMSTVVPSAKSSLTTGLIDGPKARSLYDVPESAATTDGQGITVATLQFSGWNDSALTTFAANIGVADPVASHQYQSVSVDGASTSTPDGSGGDVEVALDQETLLSVAPQADQVAYMAPNTTQGFVDGLNAVANDALNNAAGHLYTALSISWGGCEIYQQSESDMDAVDAAIANVVAAGVTVFAAAGDSGPYDCSQPDAPYNYLAVNYPASDPNAVAVGGLTTDPTAKVEQAWWTPTGKTGSNAYLGDGGGGGQSAYWATPPWQQGGDVPSAGSRMVPDIALDADPKSGEKIYAQDAWGVVGGTSLSAPLAAATLTDLQIVDGASDSYGLGNIAPYFYEALSPASFRDTTTGTNGYYSASTGFDMATGWGAPQWSELNSTIEGFVKLSVPASVNSFTIPVTVTTSPSVSYTGFSAGVGTATEPTTCDTTDETASPPTFVTATQYGATIVWVMGFTTDGNCFISEAPVTVVKVGASSSLTTTGPCRVFDTRFGSGNCAGSVAVAKAPLGAGATLKVQVAGVAGVPSNATAVVMNLTAVGATHSTWVAAWPDGTTRPTVSTLNVSNAAPTPNLAIIPIGSDGKIDLYNAAGSTNLFGDISGYFAPTAGSTLTTAGPCRAFDTRSGSGNCSGSVAVTKAPLAAGNTLTINVAGVAGIPSNATAVVMNLTAVGATRLSWVAAWPDGTTRPTVSTLNLSSANATPNLAIIPIGSDGKIDLYNAAGSTNLFGDISGYFAPTAGSTLTTAGPCRAFDTRSDAAGNCPGANFVLPGSLPAGHTLTVQVAGVAGIPSNATAVVVNLTAVGATGTTWVAAWPDGTARPTVSTLNVSNANATPNLAIVPIGSDGKIDLYNAAGKVNLIGDISGYFTN